VICPSGRPEGVTRPEKTGLTLRGEAGVWDRESGDRIKGCDGTWIHAVGSLAGADGWNITNVAAFPISGAIQHSKLHIFLPAKRPMRLVLLLET